MSDHTDSHVTGSHERTTRAGGPRVGDSGTPVGSPLTIVLAVIAVAVGFLIFRSISDDGNAAGGGLPDGATTVPATIVGQTTIAGGTPAPGVTTTVAASETRSGASVVVANASSTGQMAKPMSDQLAELGYTMGEPTSQIEGPENLEESLVYFSVGNNCEAVARTLANDMGGIDVEAMPAEVPTEGNIVDGCVLLMLGNDYAGEDVPGPPPAAPAAPTQATTTTTG